MKERMVIDLKGNKARREIVKIQEYTRNGNFDCIVFKKVNQEPETWEEVKELCKELEEKTKGKKRVVYCTLLGEIFVCLDDSFGKVGFCLSLKNIENPNRDIVHIKIINFKLNILYNSFDMPLSNSINFIKSLIGEE